MKRGENINVRHAAGCYYFVSRELTPDRRTSHVALARTMGLAHSVPPQMPAIKDQTAPADRPKKGCYLSFDENVALVDTAEREHRRDLLILAVGTGARVGALCDIEGAHVHADLGDINPMKRGELQSNRRKPIVPISGPMRPVLDRLLAQHGGRYLLRAGALSRTTSVRWCRTDAEGGQLMQLMQPLKNMLSFSRLIW